MSIERRVIGLFAFAITMLVLASASADFREDICFPVGAGECVSLRDTIVYNELMMRGATPDIIFHDEAATDEDDNARIRVNCDTTTTGIEDCDLTIGVQENGTFDDRITIDADGTLVIGSSSTNVVQLLTDGTGVGEVLMPAGSFTGLAIADDTITFGQISDSSAIDADTVFTAADGITLELTSAHTSGDTNFLTIDVDQTDDAAATDDYNALVIELASESADSGDTLEGIVIVMEDGTANTICDSAISIDNAEATASTMTDAIIITSSGANTGITDAIDVSATNITNAINIGDNPIVTGNVAMTLGDATTDAITLQTDGSGTAELVLPLQSVANGELLNDTIDFDSVNDALTLDATTTITAGDAEEVELTTSHTAGDTGAFIIDFDQADDGNATDDVDVLRLEVTSESGDTGDTLKGIMLTVEDGTANTIIDAGIHIENLEDTASTLTDAIIVTASTNTSITTAFNADDADIVNALDVGVNDILFDTGTLSTTDLEILDDGEILTGEIGDDTIDLDDVNDSLTLDATLTLTAGDAEEVELVTSHTAGDTGALIIDFDQVDDGNATDDVDVLRLEVTSESDDANDTLKGLMITVEDGTQNTIIDAGIHIENLEDTASTLTDAIIVTSTTATGITTAFNADDANIVNAIDIGVNDILFDTGSISTSDLEILDDGAIVTGEITDGTITFADLDMTATEGSDPAFATNDAFFGVNGVIFEGATADGFEGLLTVVDPTTPDNVWTLPNVTGTIVTTGDTGTVTSAMVSNDLDFDDIADSATLDADTTITMGDGIELMLDVDHTAGDTNVFFVKVDQQDDANATDDIDAIRIELGSESDDLNDTVEGITLNIVNGTQNTVIDAGINIINYEDTASTLTDGIVMDASTAGGITDAIDVSAANITNALNVGGNDIIGTGFTLVTSDLEILDDGAILTGEIGDGTITFADLDFTAAIGSDPAFVADDVYFGNNGTSGGIIFEGDAADGVEGFLVATDPTSADKTWTLPDTTGTIVTTGDTGTVDATMLAADSANTSEVAQNAVKADELNAMASDIILCGELGNSGTMYAGPCTGPWLGDWTGPADCTPASTACDATGDGTEGTADAPIHTHFPAIKVGGFYCNVSSDPTNDIVLTARTAAGDMVPTLTCTIAGSGSAQHCSATTGTTTDVAAGATIAIKSVTNEDLQLQDVWCKMFFVVK